MCQPTWQTSLSPAGTAFPAESGGRPVPRARPPGPSRAIQFDVVVNLTECPPGTPPPGPVRATPTRDELHRPSHPVRFVTAASLFDGHDAAINIMRRLLQSQGAEVVHLGHNRSVDEVVRAVVEEDAQGVAVSSYQGGHNEYFRYLVDRLRAEGRPGRPVYGGGGGVIVPGDRGARGLRGAAHLLAGRRPVARPGADGQPPDRGVRPRPGGRCPPPSGAARRDHRALARWITFLESGAVDEDSLAGCCGRGLAPRAGARGHRDRWVRKVVPDRRAGPPVPSRPGGQARIAVLAVDPTRRRGGGALLGDRIRMNAIDAPNVYFRSLATRHSGSELPRHFPEVVAACAAARFDLVIAETPGIGQGDAAVTEVADVSLYVMTPEYGASSQLEKIDMLELADVVAINKFDRRGADDAYRQVCRQWVRDHGTGARRPATSRCSAPSPRGSTTTGPPPSTTAKTDLVAHGLTAADGVLASTPVRTSTRTAAVVPPTGTATWPRSPARSAGTTPPPPAWPRGPSGPAARRGRGPRADHGLDVGRLRDLAAGLATGADPSAASSSTSGTSCARPTPTAVRPHPDRRTRHRPRPHLAVGHPRPPGGAAPHHRPR